MELSALFRGLAPPVVRRSRRARVVAVVGPLTAFGGLLWAVIQPWRITFLHPHGKGFWYLVVEAPLLVILLGVLFTAFVARPLLHDLEQVDH